MNPRIGLNLVTMLSVSVGQAVAQQGNQRGLGRSPVQRPHSEADGSRGGPTGGQSSSRPGQTGNPAVFPLEFRSIDGIGNNLRHPEWGASETVMLRLLQPQYADGVHAPSGSNRPDPRTISNVLAAQDRSILNRQGASDFVWMWGQFLDHDLDETPVNNPVEPFDIPVPAGDAWFDPDGTGLVKIPLDRSAYGMVGAVRQQFNKITAFIDASNVYGSDLERAMELRTLDGTGRMNTSAGNLLPFNENGLPNAPNTDPAYFLAGDIRANEQVALTAMHTLFVREHNYWARRLSAFGIFSGEQIYQFVRAMVAAEMQAITYREFLPALLGRGAIRPYRGYRPEVNPSIANSFATAAYRFGHTMLSAQLLRINADGSTHFSGNLPLASAFFSPQEISSIGIAPYLRGLSEQRAQDVDPFLIDDVRNFLFGPPGAGGFDLASLNIQRGRDHGLAPYNEFREAFGQSRAMSFADVTSSPEIRARLAAAYSDVEEIDAWVGFLCEDHVRRALVGRTLRTILSNQFERLRDGDRFWYSVYLPVGLVDFIEKQTLATIIRRNTRIGLELPDDVFHVN